MSGSPLVSCGGETPYLVASNQGTDFFRPLHARAGAESTLSALPSCLRAIFGSHPFRGCFVCLSGVIPCSVSSVVTLSSRERVKRGGVEISWYPFPRPSATVYPTPPEEVGTSPAPLPRLLGQLRKPLGDLTTPPPDPLRRQNETQSVAESRGCPFYPGGTDAAPVGTPAAPPSAAGVVDGADFVDFDEQNTRLAEAALLLLGHSNPDIRVDEVGI